MDGTCARWSPSWASALAGSSGRCCPAWRGLPGRPSLGFRGVAWGGLRVRQRDGLRTGLGMGAGPARDGFLVGLAVLGLLSEAAAERPLVCLVDDAQWLDRASVQVLAFVARRLAAEPVGLVFAARDPGEELARLPQMTVPGLRDDDARALLGSALVGPLDEPVRA